MTRQENVEFVTHTYAAFEYSPKKGEERWANSLPLTEVSSFKEAFTLAVEKNQTYFTRQEQTDVVINGRTYAGEREYFPGRVFVNNDKLYGRDEWLDDILTKSAHETSQFYDDQIKSVKKEFFKFNKKEAVSRLEEDKNSKLSGIEEWRKDKERELPADGTYVVASSGVLYELTASDEVYNTAGKRIYPSTGPSL